MGIHQITKMAGYVRYLQENSQELQLLFKELLIGVTNFFRDPAAWDQLRDRAIPALLASRPTGQTLRAWVPGCSTGEEAYSLAIVLQEAIEKLKSRKNSRCKFSPPIWTRMRSSWPARPRFRRTLPPMFRAARLKRFFSKESNGYRLCKEIRDMVIFAPQNLVMDPPFTKLDILSCRNLLIYLTPEVQKKLIPLFHYSLTPGGILFQGSAETIGDSTALFFHRLSGKSRLYRRTETVVQPAPIHFPTAFNAGQAISAEAHSAVPKPPESLQTLADQLVLHSYAPPAVLTNEEGDIFYVSGRTGKYLEPAARQSQLEPLRHGPRRPALRTDWRV